MMMNIVPSTMTAVVSPQTGLSFQSYSTSDTSYYGRSVIFEEFIPIYAVPLGALYPLLVQDVLEGYKGIMIEWEGTHTDGVSVAPVPQRDMDDLVRFCGEYPNVRIDILVLPKPAIFSDDQLRQLSGYNVWFDFEISYSTPSAYVDQVISRIAAVPNLKYIAYLYRTNSLNSFTDSGLAYLNSEGLLKYGVGYFNWNKVDNYAGMRSLVKTMLVTYFGQGSISSIIELDDFDVSPSLHWHQTYHSRECCRRLGRAYTASSGTNLIAIQPNDTML